MPFVHPRPPALKHLGSAAASAMLAKHFGDIAKAAKELNVNRTDLRKLTWHNPNILNAAHERMALFRMGVRSKITGAIYSGRAKKRQWGFDALFDSYEFRDQAFSSVGLLARAPRGRARASPVVDAQAIWDRETAAERAGDRALEMERERTAELDCDRRRERDDEDAVRPSRVVWGGRSWPDWRDADLTPEPAASVELVAPVATVTDSPSSELPVWPGPYPPPPLVASKYQPYAPPAPSPSPAQPWREREPRRRLFRGMRR